MLAQKTAKFRLTAYNRLGKMLCPRLHKDTERSFIDRTPRPSTLLMKSRKKLKVIEIGFGAGYNAKSLLQELDIEMLYCIDINFEGKYVEGTTSVSKFHEDRRQINESMKVLAKTGKVRFIDADSRNAHQLFRSNSVDFVYVDGAHDFNSVLADLTLYYPKVKPGGMLAGHDFVRSCTELIRAVGEFSVCMGLPYQVILPDFIFMKR